MSSWNELRELTRVRLVLLTREPEALFWMFVFPLILAAILGFAFRNTGPAENRVAVVGDAALADALRGDELLAVEELQDAGEALLGLRNGRYDAVLFAGTPPELRLDRARPEASTAELRIERALDALAAPDGGARAAPFSVAEVKAAGSRYIDYLFPGLIGLNLMGTGMWGVGFGTADLRRRKLLKRMLVTPMRRASLLLSFLLARLAWLAVELSVLTLFGTLALGVPLRGALPVYLVASFLGAAAFAGIGLCATARVRTAEGASGMLNLVMMPMWLASGVFFSYERFPDAVQPALRLLPLTAVNDALRGVMLDGESLAGVAPELLIQIVWGVAAFALALKLFRWE